MIDGVPKSLAGDMVASLVWSYFCQKIKDQENPNFSAFGTLGSLSNDPVFDPGRLGKRSDGTKISKLYAKPDNRS